MFIPLYITNSCTNSCVYCGFHISNPMKRGLSAPNEREVPSATDGNGLAGLTARVQTAGGTCRYGHDDHHVFHLDVAMPWIACQADRMKP